jgi:hypothetical protein
MYYMFLIHSSSDGRLRCFNFLATMSYATMNMGVQMSLSRTDFTSLDIYTVVGLLDHMTILLLIF